jgi:hypothetical protein
MEFVTDKLGRGQGLISKAKMLPSLFNDEYRPRKNSDALFLRRKSNRSHNSKESKEERTIIREEWIVHHQNKDESVHSDISALWSEFANLKVTVETLEAENEWNRTKLMEKEDTKID